MIEKTSAVTGGKKADTQGFPRAFLRFISPRLPFVRTESGAGKASGSDCPSYDQTLLQIEGLNQSWPDQAEHLFCIDALSWRSGEHIWLQGANGSGKTTLMRLMSGLEPVQQGRISFGAGGLRICYLHQAPYLFAGSVGRNLEFVIRSLKADKRPAARDALDLGLKLAGLQSLKSQNAVTLSGGERQRLALLRAWLLQPDLLLMDEPTANLDKESVELMHRLVTDLLEKGTVIMVSSHQQNLLTDLCHHRWIIDSGRVVAR